MKKQYTIINESCLDALDKMEENSIDAIVTDPPYEIGFMSKKWDNTGIAFSVDTWKKALRVLKPGGHLLAFNHSRTFHRIAVAIEDAGFQIRDTIMWIYGSGFPKSHNVGKSIESKLTLGTANTKAFKNLKGDVKKVKQGYIKMQVKNGARPRVMQTGESIVNVEYTSPIAKKWDGWGTALKPAYEPIILARKPIEKSVADNVIKYGVGAINIDECRIFRDKNDISTAGKRTATFGSMETISGGDGSGGWEQNENGRFPANVIHDGSEEVISNFPETKPSVPRIVKDYEVKKDSTVNYVGSKRLGGGVFDNGGSAARFFYTSKASKKDRNEGLDHFEEKLPAAADFRPNHLEKAIEGEEDNAFARWKPTKNIHPTVKPTDLMQYLIRLVAPKGAKILDLFMGSGSTGKAAMLENVDRNANYHFIGIELEKEYCDIAEARIAWAENYKKVEIEKSEKRVVNGKEAKQISIFDMKLEDIL